MLRQYLHDFTVKILLTDEYYTRMTVLSVVFLIAPGIITIFDPLFTKMLHT